jgi:hypothetical protein
VKFPTFTEDYNAKIDKSRNISHYLDPVHGRSSAIKKARSLLKMFSNKKYPVVKIADSLKRLISMIMNMHFNDPMDNVRYMQNAKEHLVGNHNELCLHKKYENEREALILSKDDELYEGVCKVIDDICKILSRINSNYTTNHCENFFSQKAKFLPKTDFMGKSSKSRLDIAVAQHEDPYFWIEKFFRFLRESEDLDDPQFSQMNINGYSLGLLMEYSKEDQKMKEYKQKVFVKLRESLNKGIRKNSPFIQASFDELGHITSKTLQRTLEAFPSMNNKVIRCSQKIAVKAAIQNLKLVPILEKKITKYEKKFNEARSDSERSEIDQKKANLKENLDTLNENLNQIDGVIKIIAQEMIKTKNKKKKMMKKKLVMN